MQEANSIASRFIVVLRYLPGKTVAELPGGPCLGFSHSQKVDNAVVKTFKRDSIILKSNTCLFVRLGRIEKQHSPDLRRDVIGGGLFSSFHLFQTFFNRSQELLGFKHR